MSIPSNVKLDAIWSFQFEYCSQLRIELRVASFDNKKTVTRLGNENDWPYTRANIDCAFGDDAPEQS